MVYGFETTGSRELTDRLQRTLPAGNTRSSTFYPPYPLALERGSGYRVWDIDGNEFVDFLNNYTSLVHGHAAPAIVEALVRQASLGTVFPSPSRLQAELAERICDRFASIERLRFTNSGSEANLIAVRAARAFTGRDDLVMAHHAYHGSWEQVAATQPHQPGIPQAVQDLIHLVDYNDRAGLEAVMQQHGDRVAAILLDPMGGSPEFFAAARELANRHGTLLILDEVVSARLHRGGYQQVLGVRPDLTTLGKIIGGGLPVGAVGGRAEIMDLFDPRRPNAIPHAGTYNGNEMTMAAGCASLDLLPQSEIDRINRLGEQLAGGLRRLFADRGIPATVGGYGSLVLIHPEPSGDGSATDALARFHLAALDDGIYFAPRGLLNTSTPMDDEVIAEAVDALTRAADRTLASSLPV